MVHLRALAAASAIIVFAASAPAGASVVPPLGFERLVRTAELVFTGEVVDVNARWVDTPTGRAIVTAVTFRVERMLKGDPRVTVTLDFLGGRIGDLTLDVAGVPRFEIGQRAVICARGAGPHVSPIVGFNQGRFRVTRDPRTGRDHVTTHDGWAFATVGQLGQPRPLASAAPVATMTLESFEREILRAAGRGGR